MKQFLQATVLASALSMTAASAATPNSHAAVSVVDSNICTRDFNPWGQAGQCQCPEQSTYDARIGLCLVGDLEPVNTTGALSTNLMAIGGETTGTVLQSDELGDVELILPLRWKALLTEADLSGKTFRVTGDYLVLSGLETGDRPTLIVNTLTLEDEEGR